MGKVIRLNESDLVRIVKRVIKEGHEMKSHQESQGRLNKFAEGLKSHLERNGYNIIDNPGRDFDAPLIENERNIIFSYDDDDVLYVYFEKDNHEVSELILSYWNLIKNELGIKGATGFLGRVSNSVRFYEREL